MRSVLEYEAARMGQVRYIRIPMDAVLVRRGQNVHEVGFMGAQEGRDAIMERVEAALHRLEARRGIADEPVACAEVEMD